LKRHHYDKHLTS